MVKEINCECGEIHIANMDIIIAEDLASEIIKYCDNYICKGKVLVIGEESNIERIKDIEKRLSKHYSVKKIIFAHDTDFSHKELALINNDIDDSRLVVCYGVSELSALIKGLDSKIRLLDIASTLCIYDIMASNAKYCIIDKYMINQATSEQWAGYYGQLMMVLMNCIDYNINQWFAKGNNCQYLVKDIERDIIKLFKVEYNDYSSAKFHNNLTEIIIQTLLWLSMLNSSISIYDTIIDNLRTAYCAYTYGELNGLTAWYIYNRYVVYTKYIKHNMLPSCDRMVAIEQLGEIGLDKQSIYSRLQVMSAEELAKRHFIYLEYREDIEVIIANYLDIFTLAIRTFRRIYTDVGYALKRDISINELANICDASIGIVTDYSLYKHYFELGYLSIKDA